MGKLKKEKVTTEDLQVKKKKVAKNKKPKIAKDLRSVFRRHLNNLNADGLKKPWMATKAFRNLTTEEELVAWVDSILNDPSRHFKLQIGGSKQNPLYETLPVVAVDTETIGLDTRIVVSYEPQESPIGTIMVPIYEVKCEIAGVCLSADGLEGVYIPINHEKGDWVPTVYERDLLGEVVKDADGVPIELAPGYWAPAVNVPREIVQRELQRLFDKSHLVFYNAKFDREVLRLTCGINFRGYPYFEDVQVLHYINDPKADVASPGKYTGDSGGLKALSVKFLKMEQIEMESLTKVKAESINPETGKKSLRVTYAPFTWIPTSIAKWYAAADAICTWLLWLKMHPLARSRRLVHKIDHELVESLTWIERQRFLVDDVHQARTVKWHQSKLRGMEQGLREIAVELGWKEETDDKGNVLETAKFNPGSNQMVAKLLFSICGLKVVKKTATLAPSVDAEAMADLTKLYPDHKFLKAFQKYKEYVALHPENLTSDPKDKSARIYLKQCVVAGGRLAASGGKFELDGGFGLNPQGIVRVEGNWIVKGDVLVPDLVDPEDVEEHEESELHPSCWKEVEEDVTVGWLQSTPDPSGQFGDTEERFDQQYPDDIDAAIIHVDTATQKTWSEPKYDDNAPERNRAPIKEKHKFKKKAPGIIKNHIANYLGYAICLVPSCKTCEKKHGVLIPASKGGRLDANEVVNIRSMFVASEGWTFFCSDYSNIEMRCAANVSKEHEFIKEFLEGAGDFHSLTASKVFPEFNDPQTSKARRKELRSLAKIINFALLYGGTEYTIYENMKKQKPDITWDECRAMVAAYWAGVPTFADWCSTKQAIAREHMTCTTATGRVIGFESALETLRIHKPTDIEIANYREYRSYVKRAEQALKEGEEESVVERYKRKANWLWGNLETGVRNVKDYNQFMGKIQRVSVNVPLQGLAGDMMRISLNKIQRWVLSDPDVQSVLKLHCSVHDEIDYAVKNEYAPFVLPRITRLMKLRKFHESREWKVPIECDTEYGNSWDVQHHLTGDDGHKPAAWTNIEGMETYVPDEFDVETLKALLKSLNSGEERRIERVRTWLEATLHPKAYAAAKYIFEAKEPKEKKHALIVALQLHEYWTIDGTPDDQEEKLETLAQYEARMGLTPENRGFMPPWGYLGAVPLDESVKVVRPELLKLEGEDPLPTEEELEEETKKATKLEALSLKLEAAENEVGTLINEMAIVEASGTGDEPDDESEPEIEINLEEDEDEPEAPEPEPEEEVLAPLPKARVKEEPRVIPDEQAKIFEILEAPAPELAPLSEENAKRFRSVLGVGLNTIRIKYMDRIITIRDVKLKEIPREFLKF